MFVVSSLIFPLIKLILILEYLGHRQVKKNAFWHS